MTNISKPIAAVMPAVPQLVIMASLGVLVVLSLIYALRLLAKGDDRMLILMFAGLALTLEEGLACFLIKVDHSPIGMYEAYQAFGVHIPLWMAELYTVFFGLGGYLMLKAFGTGASNKAFWGTWLYLAVSEGAFEVYATHIGMLTYYGPQPMMIGGFPAYMGIVNATQALAFVLVARVWFATFNGASRWLLVPAAPLLAPGVFVMMILPLASGLDSGNFTYALTGAVATICIATLIAGLALRGLRRIARIEATGHPFALAGIDTTGILNA
jgi:type IV secretory pathway TrbD component